MVSWFPIMNAKLESGFDLQMTENNRNLNSIENQRLKAKGMCHKSWVFCTIKKCLFQFFLNIVYADWICCSFDWCGGYF